MMKDEDYIKGFLINDQVVTTEFNDSVWGQFMWFFGKHFKKSSSYSEDLFQESILTMWENICKGKITTQNLSSSLYQYLLGIAIRKMMSLDRKNRELLKRPLDGYAGQNGEIILPADVLNKIIDMADDEEMEEDLKNREKKVKRAVLSMGHPCKDLLGYFYWKRMSCAEIADEMNYSSSDSVKTQKNKCMNKLKQKVMPSQNSRVTFLS